MKFMPSMEIVKVAAKASQRSKCHAKVATTDVRHIKNEEKNWKTKTAAFETEVATPTSSIVVCLGI